MIPEVYPAMPPVSLCPKSFFSSFSDSSFFKFSSIAPVSVSIFETSLFFSSYIVFVALLLVHLVINPLLFPTMPPVEFSPFIVPEELQAIICPLSVLFPEIPPITFSPSIIPLNEQFSIVPEFSPEIPPIKFLSLQE